MNVDKWLIHEKIDDDNRKPSVPLTFDFFEGLPKEDFNKAINSMETIPEALKVSLMNSKKDYILNGVIRFLNQEEISEMWYRLKDLINETIKSKEDIKKKKEEIEQKMDAQQSLLIHQAVWGNYENMGYHDEELPDFESDTVWRSLKKERDELRDELTEGIPSRLIGYRDTQIKIICEGNVPEKIILEALDSKFRGAVLAYCKTTSIDLLQDIWDNTNNKYDIIALCMNERLNVPYEDLAKLVYYGSSFMAYHIALHGYNTTSELINFIMKSICDPYCEDPRFPKKVSTLPHNYWKNSEIPHNFMAEFFELKKFKPDKETQCLMLDFAFRSRAMLPYPEIGKVQLTLTPFYSYGLAQMLYVPKWLAQYDELDKEAFLKIGSSWLFAKIYDRYDKFKYHVLDFLGPDGLYSEKTYFIQGKSDYQPETNYQLLRARKDYKERLTVDVLMQWCNGFTYSKYTNTDLSALQDLLSSDKVTRKVIIIAMDALNSLFDCKYPRYRQKVIQLYHHCEAKLTD